MLKRKKPSSTTGKRKHKGYKRRKIISYSPQKPQVRKDYLSSNGKFKKGNPGRPKGSLGKFTTFKKAFQDVFEAHGGADALLNWVQSHPYCETKFFEMVSRMVDKRLEIGMPPKPNQLSGLEDKELDAIVAQELGEKLANRRKSNPQLN